MIVRGAEGLTIRSIRTDRKVPLRSVEYSLRIVYARIYLVCFRQRTLPTIDIPIRARITNRTRFKKAFLVFFHI